MKGFTVDSDKCQRDGICVADCPAGVIKKQSADDYPEPTTDFEKFCLACGHCVVICPHKALSLDWLSRARGPSIKTRFNLTTEQVEQFLRTRRSIRNFKKEVVGRDLLNKLLEIGTYAPSAKNEQPWHWLVIQNPTEVKRLAGLVVDWIRMVIKRNRRWLGKKRITASCFLEERERFYLPGSPHLIVVHADKNWAFGAEDCAGALTYIELFATVMGLGTCWAGYFYSAANSYAPLFETLGVPSAHRIFGALMVGYPTFTYHRLPLRKPPRIMWK